MKASGVATNIEAIHARFSRLPHTERMASLCAMRGLEWWLRHRRPAVIAEIGAGPGALTTVIMGAIPPPTTVFLVEEDPVYRSLLDQYVSIPWWRTNKWDEWPEPWPWDPVECLVVDGGDNRPQYYECLAARALIFFEGRRREQRAVARRVLADAHRSTVEAEWKPRDRSKGYAVILCEPAWHERVWFAAVRTRERLLDGWARVRGVPIGKRRPA